jgi:ribosomal protein L12E/L44/L45/RPP1/RPP2
VKRPRRKKRTKGVATADIEKTQDDIEAEAAERRAKEERERLALLDKISALQLDDTPPGRRKASLTPSRGRVKRSPSPASRLSRRQRMARRIAKKARSQLEEEDEEETEEEDDEELGVGSWEESPVETGETKIDWL